MVPCIAILLLPYEIQRCRNIFLERLKMVLCLFFISETPARRSLARSGLSSHFRSSSLRLSLIKGFNIPLIKARFNF